MSRNLASLLLGVFFAFVLTLINQFIGAVIPLPSSQSVLGQVLAVVYLGALLFTLMTAAHAAAQLPYRTSTLFAIGTLLGLPMVVLLVLKNSGQQPTLPLALTASNLFLPAGVALIGAGVGRIIKHPNTLLAAAGFAIFFDVVVVTLGTVAQFQKNGSDIISKVSVGAASNILAAPGAKTYSLLTGVTIGPADVLFLAVFFSSLWLLGSKEFPEMKSASRATFPWIFGALFLALILVEVTGIPVPALVPMGVAVLIANYRYRRFREAELRLSAGAIGAGRTPARPRRGARFAGGDSDAQAGGCDTRDKPKRPAPARGYRGGETHRLTAPPHTDRRAPRLGTASCTCSEAVKPTNLAP
jgi:hypothetical protein